MSNGSVLGLREGGEVCRVDDVGREARGATIGAPATDANSTQARRARDRGPRGN